MAADLERCVIDESQKTPDWEQHGPDTQKIVLGSSPTGQSGDPNLLAVPELPTDLATRFPRLSHLYLWQVSQLNRLPELPPGLLCLEVRDCPDLATLTNLPVGLETLVVENCPHLEALPLEQQTFDQLLDLSVAGLPLTSERVNRLLAACPKLQRFDASSCKQLKYIDRWPTTLDRIDLNHCEKLEALPAPSATALPGEGWPPQLRRLGLRGCKRLNRIADFPPSIDYVDLAFTDSLTALPHERRNPRSLFLYQSGVLMPPASEHGSQASENVARRTEAYFEDVATFGPGNVRRCKLLILGNGSAGKTTLAGSLVTDEPQRHEPDSTHGVQFWDWQVSSNVGGSMRPIHLHLWDFGGQEIYHNTHRLFMSKGSVFIVVWNPDQDGQLPPPSQSGYQDEWRPLKYWLDTIHLACPHKPRIAIVCSHRTEATDDLRQRLRQQIGEDYFQQIPCYFHDSYDNHGERDQIVQWLKEEVGEVVRTQGTAVPAHWEIAQEMISTWLPKSEFGSHELEEPRYNRLPRHEFRELLHDRIIDHTAIDRAGKYAKLKELLKAGRFELNDDRLTRTLEFLTHSGWVYWNENLCEGQVIIGQKWALNAIYTVLDRREDAKIYRELKAAQGQFTRHDLVEWLWGDEYDESAQKLLISFMDSVGVIFRLVAKEESYWGQSVYKSFEHLPTAGELQFKRRFRQLREGKHHISIESDKLHKGDWHALLKNFGESYGTDGQYAIDGFYLCNQKDKHTYWVEVELDENILGGTIDVHVAGANAEERCEAVAKHVKTFLPDRRGDRFVGDRQATTVAGEPPNLTQVFFSYAWDPTTSDGGGSPGYEKPVDAIHEALLAEPTIASVRDKFAMDRGSSIKLFMDRIKAVDKILIVHSDKYWKGPYCMHEFSTACTVAWETALDSSRKNLADILILVGHPSSRIDESTVVEGYSRHWELMTEDQVRTQLRDACSLQELKKAAQEIFSNKIPSLLGRLDINRKWSDETADEIIAWVKSRLDHRDA